MKKAFPWLILGFLAFTVVLAQVLGPGEFSTLLVEGDATLGDGTAKDITLIFDDGTNRTFTWDDSLGALVSAPNFYIANPSPQSVYDDTDTAVTADGAFIVGASVTTPGSETTSFAISAYEGGTNQNRLEVRAHGGTNTDSEIVLLLQAVEGAIAYAGDSFQMEYDGGQEHKFHQEVYIGGTAGDQLILISPDGSCSSCGPDNSDVWACSPVTCP